MHWFLKVTLPKLVQLHVPPLTAYPDGQVRQSVLSAPEHVRHV